MRYLKTFENHTNYEDFTETEAFVKPNVSYCIQLNEVHYNPFIPPLIIKYNVTNASDPTKLYNYYTDNGIIGAVMFDKIEIDDVEVSVSDLDAASGQTQLSVGEHTVKYMLKDPTFIGIEYDEQTGMPTRVGALFGECTNIISAEIPNSVTFIGADAFLDCHGLISVIIPNSVTTIGGSAFGWCYSLASMSIPNSVTSIEGGAFSSCVSLTSMSIPNSVTSIGEGAFINCSGLTSVTIPNSVTSIKFATFLNCQSLTSATIGSFVTDIEENAFSNCTSLTSINIPDSVTSIGVNAFCGTNLDAATQTQIRAINADGICLVSEQT